MKKTNEEYMKELSIKNPNLEMISEYINSKAKITYRCKTHNIEFNMLPHNALKGQGCPKCKYEKMQVAKFKSHEQYVSELHDINPNVIPLEKYIKAKTPIKHKCLIHNYIWDVQPSNLLQGRGCPLCRNDKLRKQRVKTDEQYLNELSDLNSYIIPLESYKTSHSPIYHLCLKHNVKWKATPNSILSGSGCKQCGNEKSSISMNLTHVEYCEKLKTYNPYVIPLENYIANKIPIKHKCLIHDCEWIVTPGSVLQGCGCTQCKSEKIIDKLSKTHNEYIDELYNINSDIICLGTYINYSTPILHKCLNCNYEWNVSPSNILYGFGCPQCSISHGEKAIKNYLDNNNVKYIIQKKFDDCKDIRCLPFDFYLCDLNKCIEYDGKQHFQPIEFFGGEESYKTLQYHDLIKNKYCEENNIPLLRIPYYENNIETQLEQFIFN